MPFVSFGKMPKANAFLLPEEFAQEKFFDLEAGFCPACGMVQLLQQPPPEEMFHESYPFMTASSQRMSQHFQDLAQSIENIFLAGQSDPFVVEIGSNDGTLLKHFANQGIPHLGVDPSSNVAAVATRQGVATLCDFFNEDIAAQIVSQSGKASAVVAANVMCHIPDLHSVVRGVKNLLHPGGVFVFEDPYLGDILSKTAYDQIYDEHVFYFSVTSLQRLFDQHDLEIFDVAPQNVHGGSMRYFIARRGERTVSARVTAQRAFESQAKLNDPETYERFRGRCEASRAALREMIGQIKSQSSRIMGYAATSKSTTVLNYCGITSQDLESICDTTLSKQGRFTPGTHIPVVSPERFQNHYPPYALLFAWNHAAEIFAKEREFKSRGGKWISFVPEVALL